jgi:hypothetical protein
VKERGTVTELLESGKLAAPLSKRGNVQSLCPRRIYERILRYWIELAWQSQSDLDVPHSKFELTHRSPSSPPPPPSPGPIRPYLGPHRLIHLYLRLRRWPVVCRVRRSRVVLRHLIWGAHGRGRLTERLALRAPIHVGGGRGVNGSIFQWMLVNTDDESFQCKTFCVDCD